jgi:hypothetical protein
LQDYGGKGTAILGKMMHKLATLHQKNRQKRQSVNIYADWQPIFFSFCHKTVRFRDKMTIVHDYQTK